MEYSVQSVIEFVKVGGSTTAGSSAQTGDNFALVLLLLAVVLCAIGIGLKLWQKNKQAVSVNNSKTTFAQLFSKFSPWLLIGISMITLCFSILTFTHKANAADSQVSAGNIKLEYNIDTQQFSCNSASLLNNTGTDLILTDVKTELINSKAANLACNIKLGDTTIYDKTIPGKQMVSTTILQNNILNANFYLDPNEAQNFEDGQIASISYSMKTSQPVSKATFYPQPRNINYTGDKLILGSKVNVICDINIDNTTKNYVKEIFEETGISVVFAPEIVEDEINVVLSISNDTAKYPALAEHDGYVLDVNCHGINIIGQDTDAVFMGLSTIKQLLNQNNGTVQALNISDYAQAEWRGFIEGYYGIPWSNANRISLMEFGSQFKMNSYIFAPKDDEYHSAKWRDQYPADKLAGMKELAVAGLKYKVDFTWAIHPFMNSPFRFDHFEEDYNAIINKYEQLYNIGVRHFGLSADDIDGTDITAENQLKLVCALDEWCKSKGDVKKLVFVPECYQKGRGGEPHFTEYWNVMKNAPQSVDLMWTGDNVYAPTTQSTFDYFTQVSNHDAYMWWNFPVNDYCKNHLEMGPAEGLIPNVKGFIGLVANPMQQAQASKIALFSVANYLWNTTNFDVNTIWEKAFQFVDSGAPDALKLLSSHMCFSKNIWLADFDESVYMQPNLDAATKQLSKEGRPLDDDLSITLINNYKEIKDAIAVFRANHSNEVLYIEMQPWLDSFDKQCDASIHALEAIAKVKIGDKAGANLLYNQAQEEFATSKTFNVPVLTGADPVFAEAGSKYLVPFVDTMFKFLKDRV